MLDDDDVPLVDLGKRAAGETTETSSDIMADEDDEPETNGSKRSRHTDAANGTVPMDTQSPAVASAHGRAACNADEARAAMAAAPTAAHSKEAPTSKPAADAASGNKPPAHRKQAKASSAKKKSHMDDIQGFDAEARALQAQAQTDEQKRKAFKREVDDKRLRNARFFMNIAHRMTLGRTDIRCHLCVTQDCLLSVKG